MIDKTYFDRIGKYDMLMDIWGGENLGNNYKWEDDYYIIYPYGEALTYIHLNFSTLQKFHSGFGSVVEN